MFEQAGEGFAIAAQRHRLDQPIMRKRVFSLAAHYAEGFDWTPGEAGAAEALSAFIEGGLANYAVGRDMQGRRATSRLSPHLHWGEISPRRVVQAVRAAASQGRVAPAQADKFVAEIGWREFSAHLLHQFPYMTERAFRPEFDAMPWRADAEGLAVWKTGRTGYPLVDAGAVGARLDAQPRTDGGRLLPGEASADRLARGRALVLGHPGGRRPGQQCAELAVGRGLRRRCCALFPHLQSGRTGREVRPRRAVCP